MTEASLLQQIDGLEARHEEIATLLSDPAVLGDRARFAKLSKEYSELEDMVKATQRYRTLLAGVDEAKAILENERDEMLRELAKEELESNNEQLRKLEEEIKQMLVPKDPEDSRDARYVAAQAVTKQHCLPATCLECTQNIANAKAGRWRWKVPAKAVQADIKKWCAA